eukprot:c48627_g1_i1 orf=2-247(-)
MDCLPLPQGSRDPTETLLFGKKVQKKGKSKNILHLTASQHVVRAHNNAAMHCRVNMLQTLIQALKKVSEDQPKITHHIIIHL